MMKFQDFLNPPIFSSKIQNSFFLFHPNENQAQMMGWHDWNTNFIITMVSNQK